MNHRRPIGMPPQRFLRDHWQKKPLLIRRALADFSGLISPAALFRLAGRDDVEARLVKRTRRAWQLRRGPFSGSDLARLPARNWTLLVQDLNHFLPEAAALLLRFDFIPHARVDDVMISYAAPGGGVGPHVDSYDVFLLQGSGQRRWQISAQEDHQLVSDAPLKILRHFQPEQEWVLEPGDMLYLPPGYAHCGVALTECVTYSIGFRAPSMQEMASAFLIHLQDTLVLDGFYTDPELTATRHPGEMGIEMVRKATAMLSRISWDENDVADFLCMHMSEPKQHVFFSRPPRPLSLARFAAETAISGVSLALKSRMLYRDKVFHLNGERYVAPKASLSKLRELADKRQAKIGSRFDEQTLTQLYDWYLAGFLLLNRTASHRSPNARTPSQAKERPDDR